ncbi:hypothetical protein [Thiomicrospira microaerophila]|uniref:hypothetical protein n=1 Tax=Thiomicrospira microaerophila TaxID=406020 RepID=UPI0005CB68B2|nr:hypothetical protein [Thiomicrospira microaerophila]
MEELLVITFWGSIIFGGLRFLYNTFLKDTGSSKLHDSARRNFSPTSSRSTYGEFDALLEDNSKSKRDTKRNYLTNSDVSVFRDYEYSYDRVKKKNTELSDHSAEVWRRMGYRVKSGEAYAYRFYGREIYTPDQVVSINDYTGLTRNQKRVKVLGSTLVAKTGSKAAAKTLLIEHYGFKESTAKYATGYKGYYDF